MLCCISRKASARPNNQNHQKQRKPIDSDCSGSSSGFSESSSASSGEFSSSGFSATSSSSSSTSGFSSASPPSLCAFANSSSDSSSSGSEFYNRFDAPSDCLGNRASFTPNFTVRGPSYTSSSVKSFPPIPPKRLQTFLPPTSVQNRLNSGNGDSLVEKEKSAEADEPPVLLPCAICTRTFKPQSLEKHTRICEKSAIKKRKPFDSAKQRIQGTDLAEFLPKETIKRKIYQEEKPVANAANKGSWKQNHDEFLRAIRTARGETTDVPLHRQVVAPSHVIVGVPTRPNEKGMCPTCNRQFSIKSYERHVAWCKEHATRVQINPATNVAKERLEARMRYRAPSPKNRRLTNREKYSPGSAANLSNYASKNSLSNPRTKESASTPNCNNKGGNEAKMGGGVQSHQKATVIARRSGQGREEMPSGPMKSRLSDRSSRPSAEIESGPTTNPSSCPIPPRINVHQRTRYSPSGAVPPSNTDSPFPTSRSVNKIESSRIASQECGSSRRIGGSDRRAIEINIYNGGKHHQRQNIVSARSHGHPKVNDVAINDEVIGMTVQRCGLHKKDENEPEEGLVTWKQISEDKNLIKQTRFLRLNDAENLEQFTHKIKLADLDPIDQNELNCGRRSILDLGTSHTSCIQKLNQTYLIRESLETERNSSRILGTRMRRPVVKSPRTEFRYVGKTPRRNVFRDSDSDAVSPNRFNAEVNLTSSPLQSREENKDSCEEDASEPMSPVYSGRAKLAPLDLTMIVNDEISDQEDTLRSEKSTASSPPTCRTTLTKRTPKLVTLSGHELIFENSTDWKMFEEENFENSKPFDDLKVDSRGNNQLVDTSRSAGSTVTATDNCVGSFTNKTSKIKPMTRQAFDDEEQLNYKSFNEEHTGSEDNDESIQDNLSSIDHKVNIKESNQLLDSSRSSKLKPNYRKKLDDDKILDFSVYSENNTRRKHSSKSIKNVKAKMNPEENNELLNLSQSALSTVTEKDNYMGSLTRNTQKMRSMSREKFDVEQQLSFKSFNEEHTSSKVNDESIQDTLSSIEQKVNIKSSNQLLNTSRSSELKVKSRKELDAERISDFSFYNEDITSRKHSSKSIKSVEETTNTEEYKQLPTTTRSSKSTVTSNKSCVDSLKKKISKMESVDGKVTCDTIASAYLNKEHYHTLINSRRSFEDLKINNDEMFEPSDTPRSTRNVVTAMKSCRSSSPKETSKLFVETTLSCHESLNDNSSIKENYDYSIDCMFTCNKVKVSEMEIEKDCTDTLENKLSNCVEKSLDTFVENIVQSLVEPVDLLENSLESEKIKNTLIERPKNYQRCGTYVIDRAANPVVSTERLSTDEFLEEKPLVKRRRTEENITNNEIGISLISNETAEEKASSVLEPKNNVTNSQNCPSKSLVHSVKEFESTESKIESTESKIVSTESKIESTESKIESTESKIESTESKIESIDKVDEVNEIHEKYVNRNFDYDSDNTGVDNNFMKDNDLEASISTQEKLSIDNEMSNYNLDPKAFSDSIVPRETSSVYSFRDFQKDRFVQDRAEMKRKLKKKMTLLRGSTDTLVSSVETSGKIIGEKTSSIVTSYDIDKAPQVEKETIRDLDFETIGKMTESKTSCSGFLPKIPIDRIIAENDDTRKEEKFATFDGSSFWEKARKNSSTKLINLDLPKCHETSVRNTRQSNIGNLPAVVAALFKKERRRSSDRDSRVIWSNYVRRRPDFNLVLTGRTGSCKEYDPFLLAERQMNELLSDTCSDQSFTDSPGNGRRSSSPSAPNYPLSHSSAFVNYPDPVTRNLNNPDKRASLIAPPSEFDDLTADFSSDSTETNSISREILAELEDSRARDSGGFKNESKSTNSRHQVLGRRVIIDKSKALGTNEIIEDSGRKISQTNEKARKILDKVTSKVVRPHVTRSSSVRATSAPKAPERKNINSSVTATNKVNSRSNQGLGLNNRNNNYASLNGSNVSLSSIVSSEVEIKRSNSLFDELVSSFEDDTSGTYPSLRSLLKNDSLSVSSPVQSNRPRNGQISDEDLSSPDSYQRQDHSKLSADSAYSSLNRKYSNHGRNPNDVAVRLEDDSPQRRRDGDAGSTSSAKSKLSKFCHECGCKFPEIAKFCCECGIKRLAL